MAQELQVTDHCYKGTLKHFSGGGLEIPSVILVLWAGEGMRGPENAILLVPCSAGASRTAPGGGGSGDHVVVGSKEARSMSELLLTTLH